MRMLGFVRDADDDDDEAFWVFDFGISCSWDAVGEWFHGLIIAGGFDFAFTFWRCVFMGGLLRAF